MTRLEDAMHEHMKNVVFGEERPFSFLDFVPAFTVDGKVYPVTHGTFRNKIGRFVKRGIVEVNNASKPVFYTLKGHRMSRKPMTLDPTVVPSTKFAALELISQLPYEKRSVHDIHLTFKVEGLWKMLSTDSKLKMVAVSKDIQLGKWEIAGVEVRFTVHATDVVSASLACSYYPIPLDVGGIMRLTEALIRTHERLSAFVAEEANGLGLLSTWKIPDYRGWQVKMWHFGRDSSVEYTGPAFEINYGIAADELVRVYAKDMKEKGTRIRIERQEYPDKSVAEIIEKRLNSDN